MKCGMRHLTIFQQAGDEGERGGGGDTKLVCLEAKSFEFYSVLSGHLSSSLSVYL